MGRTIRSVTGLRVTMGAVLTSTRLLSLADVAEIAELLRRNRAFLGPWEPVRSEAYFTDAGQYEEVGAALQRYDAGVTHPRVIVADGRIVGRITLSGIVRGPLQSCAMGYWVQQEDNGRGVGTAAVRDVLTVAFDDLRLHRVQAETLLHNVGSQRVLERNGFERFGVAPRYLHIAGRWQDHVMYQLLAEDR